MSSLAVVAMVDAEVEAAYADTHQEWEKAHKRRNLNFKASAWLTRDEAVRVLEGWVEEYNCFAPVLLKKLPEDAEVLIAREGSVCIYVKGIKVLDEVEQAELRNKMEADECFYENDGTLRVWWD